MIYNHTFQLDTHEDDIVEPALQDGSAYINRIMPTDPSEELRTILWDMNDYLKGYNSMVRAEAREDDRWMHWVDRKRYFYNVHFHEGCMQRLREIEANYETNTPPPYMTWNLNLYGGGLNQMLDEEDNGREDGIEYMTGFLRNNLAWETKNVLLQIHHDLFQYYYECGQNDRLEGYQNWDALPPFRRNRDVPDIDNTWYNFHVHEGCLAVLHRAIDEMEEMEEMEEM